jgi:hypothetical protein
LHDWWIRDDRAGNRGRARHRRIRFRELRVYACDPLVDVRDASLDSCAIRAPGRLLQALGQLPARVLQRFLL